MTVVIIAAITGVVPPGTATAAFGTAAVLTVVFTAGCMKQLPGRRLLATIVWLQMKTVSGIICTKRMSTAQSSNTLCLRSIGHAGRKILIGKQRNRSRLRHLAAGQAASG
jgi:hypothetical protein